ncbi:hypothetical protein VWO96_08945, partial [Campylobacter coli]|nr:hypothetical protein [Campylobacter coli]
MNIQLLQDKELRSYERSNAKWGSFQIQSFKEGEKEHLCIFKNTPQDILNLRIHSECLTG